MKYPVRYFKCKHIIGLDEETGDNVTEDRHFFKVGAVEIDVTFIDKKRWKPIVQALQETKQ